jgi:hypothetical protein
VWGLDIVGRLLQDVWWWHTDENSEWRWLLLYVGVTTVQCSELPSVKRPIPSNVWFLVIMGSLLCHMWCWHTDQNSEWRWLLIYIDVTSVQ